MKHVVVNADLAYVVQHAGKVQRIEHPFVAAEFLGQADGYAGHPIAVTAGVRVLGVDGRCEGADESCQQFRLLPV